MPKDNVAILSIMSKFDEKSAREAAKRADKVYEEALSDIGNVNFDKKLIENFDKAMNLLKNKFKKVNLSSYTNSLLDSIFSDKDIKEKSKDIESFISKIEMLKKASSGQDINAFNTFSAKQIDALISRTEKLAKKQEEINEKTREYNREATKIAKANRSVPTIDKNYGNQDYSKTLESLKKSLGTEKEFTAEQNQSIENLAKMVNLYQLMEKSEPQKGTAEAIRYSKDLLAVTQKIKEERDKIDAFSQKGASAYIANNGLSSVDKVSDYTVNKSKEDFVKASLSNLKSQEAKLQSELTTYISDSVQKNLAKVSKEVDAVVDKAEKRVENLQNKIESLQSKPSNTGSNNSVIGNIVSDSDIKSLEEIEDRLYAISDLDADGEATKQQLKEYIQLYKQYEQLIASDSTVKFDPGLKEEYDSIVESDSKLKKYADTLDETISKQKELNAVKSNENEVSIDTQTEQLVKQEEQIKETIQAEKQLQDTQEKVSSNTKISVDAEQAIADINKIKESLDSIPEEKNIKITISDSDYTNTPLLSDAEGNTITAFRGVVGAWSGLINQDGIGFFTDKLKLAADYADSLAESGKVYQANLSFKNPLEVEGNGAKWDEIDFNGVKKTTDEIVELAKQLGHDGVIFKNIRDGFTDTDEDISNVMVALNAAQIKNEQVIGTVKAGTGEMVDVASKIDNATDTATNSTVESQNKIQEELKETQKIAEQVSEAMNNVGSDKSNISSANSSTAEAEKYQQITNDTVSVLTDVGKTEDQIIAKIQKERQEAEANNDVLREHLVLLDSAGKVIANHWGSKSNVNGTFTSEQLAQANGGKIIHAHPGKASFFGGKDLQNLIQNSMYDQIKQIELIWGDSTLSVDKSTLTKESSSALLNIMRNVRSKLTEIYSDNQGGTPSQEAREHINAIEKEIFKAVSQKLDISVSEKGAMSQEVVDSLSDIDKAIIKKFRDIESSVVRDINPSDIISSVLPMKDVFQGEDEKSGMDAIASATEEAVQAKKDFATANEGVQSSIDGSKSPLQLEAELMEQIAKSARESANAKKEFVEANKQVKDSVTETNEEKKRENTEENTNAWKELTYSIQRYSEVSKRISSGKVLEGDIEEASRLENKISQLQKLDILSPTQIEKSEQMLTKLYDSLDDIEKKSKETTLESLNSSIDKYRNDYNSRSSKPFIDNQSDQYKKLLANYETSIEELEAYRDKIRNNPLVSKEDLNQIDELTKKVKESATAFNSLTAAQKGSTEASRWKEIDKISKYLEKNTRLSKEAKQQLQEYIALLKSGSVVNVEEIHRKFNEIAVAERIAGREGKSFFDIFNNKVIHRFASQLAMYYLSFYDFIRYARNAITAVKELDTALIDLKKTTTMSASELEQFYYDSNDVAKKMGVTTSEIINQASAWSRLGFSTKEASTQMAELSSQFASISPGMDLDTATDGLVSSMKAFDIEVSNVERDIMDNINRIGNTAATSNDEIVDMLTRSSAAMAAANNTIQETIALETAAVEITRNAETTGTAFKTLSMRIRGRQLLPPYTVMYMLCA